MRQVDLKYPRPATGQEALLARLTRHMDARLHDIDVNWPEVLEAEQSTGTVLVRFPGRDLEQVLNTLETGSGISLGRSGDCALFRLSPDVPFEDLDYVWGELFNLL